MNPASKAFLVATFAALTVGCDADVKSALEETLRDPDSVKYEEIIRLGDRACIRYNAKNAYGGYVGVNTAHLVRLSGGSWFVESDSDSLCSTLMLERKISVDNANDVAEAEVLNLLKEKGILPSAVSELDPSADYPCKDFVEEVLTLSRLRNEAVDEGERSLWDDKLSEGMASLRLGKCDIASLQ
jgi:hypothetical protein